MTNRERKLRVKDLQRDISALQILLVGKRPPHGEVVTDAKGYAIRTKWPSNFNRADRVLQGLFTQLKDSKREISAMRLGSWRPVSTFLVDEEVSQ